MDRDEVRSEAERRLQEGTTRAPERPADALRRPDDPAAMIEELRVHQVELEIQNEELRTAQRDLERSRERYFELYELAPVGYVTATPVGAITSLNLRLCSMIDRPRRDVRRAGLFALFRSADRPAVRRLVASAAAELGETITAELALDTDPPLPVHAEIVAHPGPEDTDVRFCLTDVSRERAAIESQRATAERNELLMRELAHRTKNQLQLLLAMVTMQRQRSTSEEISQALATVEDRLRVVAAAQSSLGHSSSDTVDLVELASSAFRPFADSCSMTLSFNSRSIPVPGATALSLTLAAGELIANAVKYAAGRGATGDRATAANRSARDGATVTVRGELRSPPATDSDETDGSTQELRLVVTDDGPGLPEELLGNGPPSRRNAAKPGARDASSAGGLGFLLVDQLVRHQLGGSWVRRNPPSGGCEHEIVVAV